MAATNGDANQEEKCMNKKAALVSYVIGMTFKRLYFSNQDINYTGIEDILETIPKSLKPSQCKGYYASGGGGSERGS